MRRRYRRTVARVKRTEDIAFPQAHAGVQGQVVDTLPALTVPSLDQVVTRLTQGIRPASKTQGLNQQRAVEFAVAHQTDPRPTRQQLIGMFQRLVTSFEIVPGVEYNP